MMIFVLAGGIALAVYLYRKRQREGNSAPLSTLLKPTPRPPTDATAQELLEWRFASGEIEVDEYERRRDALKTQDSGSDERASSPGEDAQPVA
jgi:uncharacterized membrane protein